MKFLSDVNTHIHSIYRPRCCYVDRGRVVVVGEGPESHPGICRDRGVARRAAVPGIRLHPGASCQEPSPRVSGFSLQTPGKSGEQSEHRIPVAQEAVQVCLLWRGNAPVRNRYAQPT